MEKKEWASFNVQLVELRTAATEIGRLRRVVANVAGKLKKAASKILGQRGSSRNYAMTATAELPNAFSEDDDRESTC